jgi:hypothetical protein
MIQLGRLSGGAARWAAGAVLFMVGIAVRAEAAPPSAAPELRTVEEAKRAADNARSQQRERERCIDSAFGLREKLSKKARELGSRIAEIARAAKRALDELLSGRFCSKCDRTASEIEKVEKQSFSQHLGKVKGKAVAAGADRIARKKKEYEDRIRGKEREKASAEKESKSAHERGERCRREWLDLDQVWRFATDQARKIPALLARAKEMARRMFGAKGQDASEKTKEKLTRNNFKSETMQREIEASPQRHALAKDLAASLGSRFVVTEVGRTAEKQASDIENVLATKGWKSDQIMYKQWIKDGLAPLKLHEETNSAERSRKVLEFVQQNSQRFGHLGGRSFDIRSTSLSAADYARVVETARSHGFQVNDERNCPGRHPHIHIQLSTDGDSSPLRCGVKAGAR